MKWIYQRRRGMSVEKKMDFGLGNLSTRADASKFPLNGRIETRRRRDRRGLRGDNRMGRKRTGGDFHANSILGFRTSALFSVNFAAQRFAETFF